MRNITVRDIFFLFLKIGTFAFGGAYSMLSFFERELVERRKWLTHEEYLESVAIGQMTPGPPIVNTGICIGYKLKRVRGALATTLGQAFTGTVLAIVLAMFYVKAGDSALLRSVMKGVGASVVGLLLSVIYRMSAKTLTDLKTRLFALAAFVALAVFKLNPIGLIIAAGIAGLIVYRGRKA
jgi:chromate transporter